MTDNRPQGLSKWRSPIGLFMVVAGALGAYYLLTEHFTHVAQAVPFLFLLACPLMHLFHGGHAHGSQHQHDKPGEQTTK